MSYNERERRLILEEPYWPDSDQSGVVQAIEAHADPERGLIVDLTRLPAISTGVAAAIACACQNVDRRGCRVRIWTRWEPATRSEASRVRN
jgi:hypothetical protein